MKESGIIVDFEWAYKQVVSSHDFTGKNPAWVKVYVESWCEGYLKGFFRGMADERLRIMCRLIQAGMSSDEIAKATETSHDLVKMIKIDDKNASDD